MQVASLVTEEQVGGACVELLQAGQNMSARLTALQPTGQHLWPARRLSRHVGADAEVATSYPPDTTDGWHKNARKGLGCSSSWSWHHLMQ